MEKINFQICKILKNSTEQEHDNLTSKNWEYIMTVNITKYRAATNRTTLHGTHFITSLVSKKKCIQSL